MTRGVVEAYHDDQMVVALSDQPLVEQALARFNVRFNRPERDPVLGLALLHLDPASIGQAIPELMADPQISPGLTAYQAAEAHRLGPLPVSNLNLLVKGLRLKFSAQYPNWAGPQIGKNRGINTLGSGPEIGPGQVGDPEITRQPLPPRIPRIPPQPRPGRPRSQNGQGVLVGQIDGLMFPHPWLAGGYTAFPADQVRLGNAYQVNQGHAAAVASCILGRAPAAHVHLRRVLNNDGAGDAWTAARQMAELADVGCDVVNVSVGQCFSDDGKPPLALDTAVRVLSTRSIIIAAAGNHGNVNQDPCPATPWLTPSSVYYPAGCEGAIAVGALDADGKAADFNPKDAPYIRLLASGTGITVAYLDGTVKIQHHCQETFDKVSFKGWATVSGTSFAAAVVTGEIARRTIPGKVTAREALDQLLNAKTPIPVPNPHGGIIQAC